MGFPRVGATLVRQNLEKFFGAPVYQTHDARWPPRSADSMRVLVYREDVLAALFSYFVMHHSGEMVSYSGKKVEPFVIDPIEFDSIYRAHRDFYKNIDLSKFQRTIKVCYETVMEQPRYLFSLFGIERTTDYQVVSRCPYQASSLVTNYTQICKRFRRLEKNELY